MISSTAEHRRATIVQPILRELTERLPSFSIFKHTDGALDGTGDADCSLTAGDLEMASEIIASNPAVPRPAWFVQCDHLFEARLHFIFVPWEGTRWLPIEIDLKYYLSSRFGLPWADPTVIADLSVLGDHGIRKLGPGPEVLLELFNYGTVSPEAARRVAERMAPKAPREPCSRSVLLLPKSMQAPALRCDVPGLIAMASDRELERCALLLRRIALRQAALHPHRLAVSIVRRIRGQQGPRCRTALLARSGRRLAPIEEADLRELAVTDQLSHLGGWQSGQTCSG